MGKEKTRCGWATQDPLYVAYHDSEWGTPNRDERHLFEMLCLEGAQAGLSWITILRKRDAYRQAFDGFDAEKIARYRAPKLKALLENPGIVRNRLKVQAAVTNAQALLALHDEGSTLNELVWSFVGGKPRKEHRRSLKDVPATTAESDAMSAELRRRGFKFVGSTICYAFMQACGLVNDHVSTCFRSP